MSDMNTEVTTKTLNTAKEIADALMRLITTILDNGKSEHGEASVALAMKAGKAVECIPFDVANKDPAVRDQQMQYMKQMMQQLQAARSENGGVGQVCFMAARMDDGRMCIIYQKDDHDRVQKLSRAIDGMDIMRSVQTFKMADGISPDR